MDFGLRAVIWHGLGSQTCIATTSRNETRERTGSSLTTRFATSCIAKKLKCGHGMRKPNSTQGAQRKVGATPCNFVHAMQGKRTWEVTLQGHCLSACDHTGHSCKENSAVHVLFKIQLGKVAPVGLQPLKRAGWTKSHLAYIFYHTFYILERNKTLAWFSSIFRTFAFEKNCGENVP